jgi:spore germination protein GerM
LVVPEVETRDRAVYLMQLDRDGTILRPIKVIRKLRVSSSPLQDSLNALLAGPTAEEKISGLDSFIPQNSGILSVRIEGDAALSSLNEEFQYNSLGREGCEAQIRQIVWTATEFPNIHNVQFLINGKRVDFLSEGINVTYPIGR